MTTIVLPQPAESQPGGRGGIHLAVASTLTVWFSLVVSLGMAGAFVAPPGRPPVPIAVGVAAPLALFFASLRLSRSFRDFVLSLDLRLIAAIQAWRWAGLGFFSPSTPTRCSRLCSPSPPASATWLSGSRPRG